MFDVVLVLAVIDVRQLPIIAVQISNCFNKWITLTFHIVASELLKSLCTFCLTNYFCRRLSIATVVLSHTINIIRSSHDLIFRFARVLLHVEENSNVRERAHTPTAYASFFLVLRLSHCSGFVLWFVQHSTLDFNRDFCLLFDLIRYQQKLVSPFVNMHWNSRVLLKPCFVYSAICTKQWNTNTDLTRSFN